MNTRFEFNYKNVGVRGDDTTLYFMYDEKIVIKVPYKDVEAVSKYLWGFIKPRLSDNQLQSTITSGADGK